MGRAVIRRSARWALEAVAVLVAGAAILLSLAAWWLSTAPLRVDFLTPYLEAAMADAPVGLALGGTELHWQGFERPLVLVARDVDLFDPLEPGRSLATVPRMAVTLSGRDLIRGRLVPRRLDLVEPSLFVERRDDGVLSLALGAPDGPGEAGLAADLAAELAAESLLRALRAPPDAVESPMAALEHLRILDGIVFLDDRLTGRVWQATASEIDLRRTEEGVGGTLALALHLDSPRPTHMTGTVQHAAATGATRLTLDIAGLVPADLAAADPLLAPLTAIDSVVQGQVQLSLDADGMPDVLDFSLVGRAGVLHLAPYFSTPRTVAGLTIDGSLDFADRRLSVHQIGLDLGGPSVVGAVTAVERDGAITLSADAVAQDLPVDLLATYWPPALAEAARDWVVDNVTRGMARRGSIAAELTIPLDAPDRLIVHRLDGDIAFDGAALRYMEGMPQVTDIVGTARFEPDAFHLHLTDGRLGEIVAEQADITIQWLEIDLSVIDIDVVASGPFATALAVVDAPRLGYASELGLEPAAASGEMAARLRFTFPIIRNLTFDMVQLAVAANLSNVALRDVAGGHDLSGFDGTLDLDGAGMQVVGQGALAGTPLEMDWRYRFSRAADPRSLVRLHGDVSIAGLERLGLPVPEGATGSVALVAEIAERGDGDGHLAAEFDLRPAAFALPVLGWDKPLGDPALLAVNARLRDSEVAAVEALRLEAPGLAAAGSLSFERPGGGVTGVRIDHLRYGETDLFGEAARVGDAHYRLVLRGEQFDAEPWWNGLDAFQGEATAATDEERPRIDLEFAFDRVRLDADRTFHAVSGAVQRDRRGWPLIDLTLHSAGAAGPRAWLHYVRGGDGSGDLQVELDDAGALLAAFEVSESVRGGRLILAGRRPPGPLERPIEGGLVLEDYRVVGAPILARLLAAASPAGLGDLLTTDGLGFERLESGIAIGPRRIVLRDGRTAGGALGMTFAGAIDRAEATVDVVGTLVPMHLINEFLGAIPLLGTLLTAGRGDALLAFTYSVRGPMEAPAVAVNPLSGLAPGVLRQLLFEETPAE